MAGGAEEAGLSGASRAKERGFAPGIFAVLAEWFAALREMKLREMIARRRGMERIVQLGC